MNRFVVQNKSQATKALGDRMKIFSSKSSVNIQGLTRQKKSMETFLSTMLSRTFVQNIIPIKNHSITKNK